MTKPSRCRVTPFPNVDRVALALSDAYGDPAHGNKMNLPREPLFPDVAVPDIPPTCGCQRE